MVVSPVFLRVGAANFEVRWDDLQPELQTRLTSRLQGNDLLQTATKLLEHMLLDFSTLNLASADDLKSEVQLTESQIKALTVDEREWSNYKAEIARMSAPAPAAPAFPPFQVQPAQSNANRTFNISLGPSPATTTLPQQPPSFAQLGPSPITTTLPQQPPNFAQIATQLNAIEQQRPRPPVFSQPAGPMQTFQPAAPKNQKENHIVHQTDTPQPALPSESAPAQGPLNPPAPNQPVTAQPVQQPEPLVSPPAPAVDKAPEPAAPAEPPVQTSREIPDSDDVDFADLVNHVILMVHNPNEEEDTDAASIYSMRFDAVQDKLDALGDYLNKDMRADKAKFDAFAKELKEEESQMLSELLFKAEAERQAAAMTRPAGGLKTRPKQIKNASYGGVSTSTRGQMGDVDVHARLESWDDLEKYAEAREKAFAERGSGSLVPMPQIIHAINDYGQQSKWHRDENNKFTVRPIQGATLPQSLKGHNLVATAETGSGKTMCFAVVAIAAVVTQKKCPQVLIMAHNRPLLDQLCDEMDKLCTSLNNQIKCSFVDRDERGDPSAQIVLSTAGQLKQKVSRNQIPVREVKLVIADEVDDIFSQNKEAHGERDLISSLIQQIERNRKRPQVLFFSATIGDDENDPDDRALRSCIDSALGRNHIVTKAQRKDVAGMTHVFVVCPTEDDKFKMIPWLLTDPILVGSAMVFCKRKDARDSKLAVKQLILQDNDCRRRLAKSGQNIQPEMLDGDVGVELLSGVQEFTAGQEVTRDDRMSMMRRFRENKARILIATDAVAKGIDVPNVTMVVHVELCKEQRDRAGGEGFNWLKTKNKALDQYRHRAGRTARSLQKGVSITLISPGERPLAQEYMSILKVGEQNHKFVESAQRESIKQFLQDAQI